MKWPLSLSLSLLDAPASVALSSVWVSELSLTTTVIPQRNSDMSLAVYVASVFETFVPG
jgi:hypothetical protein